MTPSLFVTGASGFVGRCVLQLLARSGAADVRLLTRNPEQLTHDGALPAGWTVVRGDLADAAAWASHLRGVETVLHLAASTGKVRRREHFATIVGGTARLLEASRGAGVTRFLFVSSVAAGFANRRYYHYAAAKAVAETVVRTSGLDALVVRPTMVLGPGSAVLAGLRTLALLPVPLMFGPGTDAVEPIFVEDLAAILVAALEVRPWNGDTITVGGPERVTTEALLRRIRAPRKGDGRGFAHIPLAPVRELLGALEPVLFPVLPLTAGQLATFANASVGEASAMRAQLPAATTRLDAMLSDGTHG